MWTEKEMTGKSDNETYFCDVASECRFVYNFYFVVRLANDSKSDGRVVGDGASDGAEGPWKQSAHERAQ